MWRFSSLTHLLLLPFDPAAHSVDVDYLLTIKIILLKVAVKNQLAAVDQIEMTLSISLCVVVHEYDV